MRNAVAWVIAGNRQAQMKEGSPDHNASYKIRIGQSHTDERGSVAFYNYSTHTLITGLASLWKDDRVPLYSLLRSGHIRNTKC